MGRIEIQILQNGFVLEYEDPKIEEENRKSKSGYISPYKRFAYSSEDELMEAVKKTLPMLQKHVDDQETEFDKALTEAVDD